MGYNMKGEDHRRQEAAAAGEGCEEAMRIEMERIEEERIVYARLHALTGNFEGFRECHIKPDWLLVYLIENDILTLTLVDTGSHSDIFK